MRNEMEPRQGNNLKQEEVPVVRMNGAPQTEAVIAEQDTWERELSKLNYWYWPGWAMIRIIGQVGILFVVFLYSGPLLRLIDPTASALDPGILSALLLAVLLVDAFVVSAWLLLRLVHPTLTDYYEWDYEHGELKKGITACLETKIITGSFWGLLLLFCVVFWVLL